VRRGSEYRFIQGARREILAEFATLEAERDELRYSREMLTATIEIYRAQLDALRAEEVELVDVELAAWHLAPRGGVKYERQ